jgi:hypothetical protein
MMRIGSESRIKHDEGENMMKRIIMEIVLVLTLAFTATAWSQGSSMGRGMKEMGESPQKEMGESPQKEMGESPQKEMGERPPEDGVHPDDGENGDHEHGT